jgi:translocation and assembly module TamB
VRKKLLITLGVVLGLVAIALIGVFYWWYQGGLDNYFKRRLIADLAEMNILVEVEGATIELRPGKVVLTDLKLFTPKDVDPETAEPFAMVDQLVAEFEITSLWARTLDIKSLTLVQPVVNVRFDEEGRSNLAPIVLPEGGEEGAPQQITYLAATVDIQEGQINYGDETRRLDGSVDRLLVSFVPKLVDDKTTIDHHLTVQFYNSELVYEDRPLSGIHAALEADVTREGATIQDLTLVSPAGTTEIEGTIAGWRDLAYKLEVASTVSLDRIGAVADPNAGIAGTAAINGTIEGKGAEYAFNGRLSGNDVLVAGVRIADASLNGQLQGERLDYQWIGQLVASRLTGFGLDVSGIRFDGRVDGSGENAAINGALTASRVAGDDFVGTGLRFDGRVDTASRAATGDVGLTSIAARTVRAGRIDASITATPDRVDVERFTAIVYGGTVSGSARAQLGPGGTSSLEAAFRGVDVDQAIGAATADAPRLRGRASGTVNLTWPGVNVQAASGTIRADVDGTIPSETGETLPIDGQLALTATPGRFRIDRAEFTSGESRVTATGTVGWDRRADIDLTAEAAESSDLVALLGAANPEALRTLDEYSVEVGGAFRFEGNVAGYLNNPTVDGQLEIGNVKVLGQDFGALTASIDRRAAEMVVDNASIRAADGSEIAFDVTLPAREGDPVRVAATLDNVPVARLAAIANPDLSPNGTVDGTINLQIPRTGNTLEGLRGDVDVAINGATFNGEEVRDFRVRTNLGADTIEVPDLRIETARGALDGSVVFDKRTSTYRASFDAANVDLSLLRNLQPDIAISGVGTGTVELAGTLVLPEYRESRLTNLTANVTATDVVVNGQEVGNPQITVQTANDVATVRLNADVLGARRELAGTISLTDAALPFEFTTELQDANLAPYAALAGVRDLPPGLSTDVTGTLRVAGQLNPDDGGIGDNLQISGNFSELSVMASLDESGRAYTLSNRGDVVFSSTGDVVRFERSTFTGEGTELTIEGALALAPEATSSLTLSGDVNLALLGSAAPGAYAAGVASLQATVAGTRSDPRFSGFADVRDASLRVVDLPVGIQNGNGRIIFNANQAYIESFSAMANGGRVSIDGGVLFEGLRPARWRFGIDAQQVRVTYPEDVRSIIDGDLALQGNAQLQVLSGVVNVRRAEYTRDVELNDLLNLDNAPATTTFGEAGGGPASPIRLDLLVEARDSLIIRNNLADVVASANLEVTGPLNDPIIDGRATVSRGTIKFRNDDYQVSRGVVRFPGRIGDITIDLQAETEIRGYRVTVGLTGTPDRPYPVLRSDPPLPETQIASLILTGELSGNEDITASTVAQSGVGLASSLLSAAVSESVQRRTSQLFGINRFQISPVLGSGDPSARITIGRQVNKNLAITYTTNVSSTDEQVIQIEYRISDRFSVVAVRDEDGAFGIDFRVKKRF